MNQRIQQLYKQAHITQEKQVRAGGWDNDREPFEYRTVTETNFDPEKFAELIVKDCINKIETHRIPVGNSAAGEMACEWTYAALKEIRDEIKEHFGVGE